MINARIKQYFVYALLIAAGWFLLSNHFIYFNKRVHLLKKSEPSLWYTFYSMDSKRPEHILKIDHLRHDGIGQTMVDVGMITEDERFDLEAKFEMGAN